MAALSRVISLIVGLVSGYMGGMTDRVLMSINDTFIVIPLFPILVLFYFVMRDQMSWVMLAVVMARVGLGLRRAADPIRRHEPADPRVHPPGVFSGMSTGKIVVAGAPALRAADRLLDDA